MRITLEISYDEAVAVRACLAKHLDTELASDTIDALDTALENENEARYDSAMESDGESADIRYRADMKDAGRGHQLR